MNSNKNNIISYLYTYFKINKFPTAKIEFLASLNCAYELTFTGYEKPPISVDRLASFCVIPSLF